MSREGLWFWFKPTPGKRPLKKIRSSGFHVKQDSEIAPRRRPSTSQDRLRMRSKEFLIKKLSDLCELCASAVNTSSQKTRNSQKIYRGAGDYFDKREIQLATFVAVSSRT